MTTVQQIYDMAIHLMDEQSENNGGTETVDTTEYKYRTVSILNSVIPALYPFSSGYEPTAGARPFPGSLDFSDYKNPNFEQEIPLDDTLCLTLLPYFLAAQLLSGENEDLAAWFMNRYREAFNDLRSRIPAEFEKIQSPYNLY